jgi:hypothetical protein
VPMSIRFCCREVDQPDGSASIDGQQV